MKEMLAPVNRFVDAMIDSEGMFQQVKQEIELKNRAVEHCIGQIQKEIQEMRDMRLETDDASLKQLYENLQSSLGDLLTEVTSAMEKNRTGTKFIQDHEQSFNIAVFGKVKAGKSYLGNFIMGNQLRDMGLKTSYDRIAKRPVVEVYDRGTVHTQDRLSELTEDGNENFFVDANEATSSIQLFHLGGMAWFDTPGIGSVTWENEMLAKDYVDNADLVVYASNSDAAGTRQDFAEMRELYNKNKQFLLLLTQSDTVEEYDIDDETGDSICDLVAKSEKDQRDTESYMIEELAANGLPKLRKDEILTISAKLAMNALEEDDPEKFKDSHMGDFLDVLTNITKTDGARLKRETPFVRMRSTLIQTLEILNRAEQKLKKHKESLIAKQKELGSRNRALMTQMRQQCRRRIDTIITKRVMEIENSGTAISSDELSAMVSDEIYTVMEQTCASEFSAEGQILSDYKDKLRLDGVGNLEMKKDTITYTVPVVRRVLRDPDGIIETICSIFGKEYYTSKVEDKSKSSTFDIGINEGEVRSLTFKLLDQLFEDQVPVMMKQLSERYLSEITNLTGRAGKCILSAKSTLKRDLEGLKQ